VVVDLDDQGERTFTFMVRPSADLFLAKKTCRSLPPTSGCTSAPSRSAPNPAAAPPSRRWRNQTAGGRVSFDPNIRPDLWQDQELLHACLDRALRMANVVKLSEEELVFISSSNDLAYGIASVPSAISQNCYW
jgi:fructokinase